MLMRWILLIGVIGRLTNATDFHKQVCEPGQDICQKKYPENSPKADDASTEDDPINIVRDNEVPVSHIATKNHAKLTAPDGVFIRKSTIPMAGLGAFTKTFISNGVRFGQYVGVVIWERDDTPLEHLAYAWQIDNANGTGHYVDAVNPAKSNWMRYVNCARNIQEQNMDAYQIEEGMYYETIRAVYPGEELLVYYGDGYAETLGFTIEKKVPPENAAILFDNVYEVSVETGDQSDAGTNATIYVTAEGEYDSVSYDLRDEDGRYFERGNTDTFKVSIYSKVGEISRIRIGHNNNGDSGGWYLVKLTMTGNITGRTLVFNCNCWLDPSNGTVWYRYVDVED